METLRGLIDLVYPRLCVACGARVGAEAGHVCWDCRAGFTFITDDFCSRCGDPIDGVSGQAFECSACVQDRPAFERARSAVRHRGGFRDVLWAFKYENATCLASDLCGLLAGCVSTHYGSVPFDAVTCVPLHPRKERERTYNQSALLGTRLARKLGVAFYGGCLRRLYDTPTQTHLSAAARRRNVRGAFAVRTPEWVEGRTLLLVDDVMTTGATVDAVSRVLKKAGAAAVHVATVARG